MCKLLAHIPLHLGIEANLIVIHDINGDKLEVLHSFKMAESEASTELTEEQHAKLAQYQEVTGVDDVDKARLKLIEFNWNLELAVHDAFNESEGITSHHIEASSIDSETFEPQLTQEVEQETSTVMMQIGNVISNGRRLTWAQWLFNLVFIPYKFTVHSFGSLFTYLVQIIWPGFGRYSGDPLANVLDFKKNFESEYSLEHPTFYQGLYSQALSDAKRELRFLLVYLHSDSHQDTPKFCREVLCNPGFKEYVNGNMLFWGCDVNTYEGYRVSKAIRESTYPFLAVICLRQNRMTIVARIEGFMQVDELVATLARVIDENEPSLVAARAEREERSMSQTLREEQDKAYQLALKEDREKARKKKESEDAKVREESLRRDRELEKERRLQNIAEVKADCRRRLESIPEPDPSDPNTVQIRIKLPDGETVSRRFSTLDQFKVLADFVHGMEETPEKFTLNSNFPRKTFQPGVNRESTLAEIGITSSTILFVQNLCDDSSDDEQI